MQVKKSKDFFKSLAAAFTDVDADNKMLLAVIDVINKDGEDAGIDVANNAPAVCARFYLVDPARKEETVVPAGDYTVAVIITDTTNAAINADENELDSEKENISEESIENNNKPNLNDRKKEGNKIITQWDVIDEKCS